MLHQGDEKYPPASSSLPQHCALFPSVWWHIHLFQRHSLTQDKLSRNELQLWETFSDWILETLFTWVPERTLRQIMSCHSFTLSSPETQRGRVCERGSSWSRSKWHGIEQVVAAASALICQPPSAGITGITSDSLHALNTSSEPERTVNNYESNPLKSDTGTEENTQLTHSPFTSDEALQR